MTCAIALAIACACGGGSTETPAFQDTRPLPDEPMVMPAASIGTYGGRFVVSVTSAPQTFNGIMALGASSTNITWQTHVGLTGYDNSAQEITPALAKGWELGPDGLTWTFHLRKGAAFSDGHPITAEDVVFSFDVSLDDTLNAPSHDHFVMNGKKWKVTALDPLTVVIQTPGPNAVVPELVTSGTFTVMPKHVLEPAFRSGTFASAYGVHAPPDSMVTSGPWRVQQHLPGDRTVLVRNPYWFGVDAELHRLPYLNELVHLIVPEQDVDVKLRSGDIDGLGSGPSTNFFWFNLNKARNRWFSNLAFRQAVSMAIDRDAMISKVLAGAAAKSWSPQATSDNVWASADIIHYDYNLAEAKRTLERLRWTDNNGDGFLEDPGGATVGFTLKTDRTDRYRVAMANAIRDDLAKVGINVTVAAVDFSALITNLTADFDYDAALLGFEPAVPPNPVLRESVFRSSGRSHFWNIGQPQPETPEEARIDALMDAIESAPDLDQRKAAWKEIENLVNYQCWLIWLPTIEVKLPPSNRFGNVQPSASPLNLLWNSDRVYVKTSGPS